MKGEKLPETKLAITKRFQTFVIGMVVRAEDRESITKNAKAVIFDYARKTKDNEDSVNNLRNSMAFAYSYPHIIKLR